MKFHSYKYFLNKKFNNWNPDKFDWENEFKFLAKYCQKYFSIWWDSEKCNWFKDSDYLAEYCNEYIEVWWDKEKYNWRIFSHYLASYCNKYFEIWWDENKFIWDKDNIYFLIKYSYDNINLWWDINRIAPIIKQEYLNSLIEINKEKKLLPEKEIIKLKLLIEN